MLLAIFDDTVTNKLKHQIKQYAGVTYLQLICHLRKEYRKLHALNIAKLLVEMASYFNIDEEFSRYFKKMKEAQQAADITKPDLINDATLLCIEIEEMYECDLFERVLNK